MIDQKVLVGTGHKLAEETYTPLGALGPSAQVVSTYLKNSKQLSTLDIHLAQVYILHSVSVF